MASIACTNLVMFSIILTVTVLGVTPHTSKYTARLSISEADIRQAEWKTRVGDAQISVDYKPSGYVVIFGGKSSWSASLEHNFTAEGNVPEKPEFLQPSDNPQDPGALTTELISHINNVVRRVGILVAEAQIENKMIVAYVTTLGRYSLVKKPMLEYEAAIEYCEEEFGYLATIDNPDERRELSDLLAIHEENERGLYDLEAYVNLAMDGRRIYKRAIPWPMGEHEYCLTLRLDGLYVQSNCNNPRIFLCERDQL
uniref:C-type lectin domain-containing protein n=1 Tax=Timema shepardi TaxID=629360 RepID=A0A7R9B047_TIMSH|nr:unnamed protein product [Timema shepardi]